MQFFQTPPELENQFESDHLVNRLIDWKFKNLDSSKIKEIKTDLMQFGERVRTDVLEMAKDAEANPPTLKQFDAWGNRIDHIETPKAWKELEKVSAEEGIVAHGYLKKYGELSRLFQFIKLYMFHPSSAFYSCPLAMTDGAAKLIELSDDQELKNKAYQNIISMDPEKFWTSGQWMTEKTGGSDVGLSETIARQENGEWKLHGVKWFTSATTSQMAMALARIEENGKVIKGTRGLSLFYIELRDDQSRLQNIEILRLKDKLGTKALPTAELHLNGTPAKLVGKEGEGVKTIASLFNVTRIYNATTTIGSLRRLLNLSKDYAKKRFAFKKNIIEHPLHLEILTQAEVDLWAMSMLTFHVAELLGIEECGGDDSPISKNIDSNKISKVLRLLTPIAKLYTAKINMQHTSELVESFGGAGYIEDTGIPQFLRDSQVFAIWEGTTNVLCMDVLRAILKEDAAGPYMQLMQKKASEIGLKSERKDKCIQGLKQLQNLLESTPPDQVENQSRNLAFGIGNVTSAILLCELAENFPNDQRVQNICDRFLEKDFVQKYSDPKERHMQNQGII